MRVRIISPSEGISNINMNLTILPTELTVVYSFMETESTVDEDGNMQSRTKNTEEKTLILPLSELQARRDWKSGCTFSLVFDHMTHRFVGMMNNHAESYSARRDHRRPVKMMPREYSSPIRLVLPFEEADFSDIGIQVFQNKEPSFTSNEPFEVVESGSIDMRRKLISNYMPKCAIEGPDTIKSGEVEEYTVSTTRLGAPMTQPLELYIEHSSGYVSHKRVTTINGQAVFRVQALQLVAGDTIEIKVGLKFLASIAKKVIEVN